MASTQHSQRVTVVGAGLIGSSWAVQFLAPGLEVITDPARDSERSLRDYVDRAWPVIARLGLAAGATCERLRFTFDRRSAIDGTGFVQESDECERTKVKLFALLDRFAPPDASAMPTTQSAGLGPSIGA